MSLLVHLQMKGHKKHLGVGGGLPEDSCSLAGCLNRPIFNCAGKQALRGALEMLKAHEEIMMRVASCLL